MRDEEIRRIAVQADLSERGVRRLLGSLRVLAEEPQSALRAEIGLNLQPVAILEKANPSCIEPIVGALREYRNSCPRVVEWVGRGDFSEAQSSRFEKRVLLHAVRTASRIRAALLRAMPAPSTSTVEG